MHFYDPEGQVGKIVAESLGEPGQTAWDVYLFYKASDQWDKELPQPAAWVHQLMGTWMDHYRSGQDLETELHSSASRLLKAWGLNRLTLDYPE